MQSCYDLSVYRRRRAASDLSRTTAKGGLNPFRRLLGRKRCARPGAGGAERAMLPQQAQRAQGKMERRKRRWELRGVGLFVRGREGKPPGVFPARPPAGDQMPSILKALAGAPLLRRSAIQPTAQATG